MVPSTKEETVRQILKIVLLIVVMLMSSVSVATASVTHNDINDTDISEIIVMTSSACVPIAEAELVDDPQVAVDDCLIMSEGVLAVCDVPCAMRARRSRDLTYKRHERRTEEVLRLCDHRSTAHVVVEEKKQGRPQLE
jgi:hypothetical protein